MGTRPEIIKMAPVIRQLKKYSDIKSIVLTTSQHREMSNQMFDEFDIIPDIDLDIMIPNQTLSYLTSRIAAEMENVLNDVKPDVVLVQGDTTSAAICGLVSYYHRIPVGHIEAGLRTYDPGFPFPEEINRQLISRLATFNFVPTQRALKNLLSESIDKRTIYFTGNTVVDALQHLMTTKQDIWASGKKSVNDKRLILVTAHRRENFGQPMENICLAIKNIINQFDDVEVIFPVHPNPNVREIVYKHLDSNKKIRLIEPLIYTELIRIMAKAEIILTDSGGIQEEAPTMKKPVLILRGETERPEVVEAGGAILVGTDKNRIVEEACSLLTDARKYRSMTNIKNPFGDGRASNRIVDILRLHFELPLENKTPSLEEFYSPSY